MARPELKAEWERRVEQRGLVDLVRELLSLSEVGESEKQMAGKLHWVFSGERELEDGERAPWGQTSCPTYL